MLLVEDDPGDELMTREAFEDNKIGNTLHVAHDGVEALDFLYQRGEYADAPRPDLILLDLNLPKYDGRQVLEKIKGDPGAARAFPVVVLTTSSAEEDILRSYKLHANAYVTKPVDFDQFIAVDPADRRVLRHRRAPSRPYPHLTHGPGVTRSRVRVFLGGVVGGPAGEDVGHVLGRPLLERRQHGAQGLAERGEPVFDPGRHRGEHGAMDQPVTFEAAQRLREHLLADPGEPPAQRREPLRLGLPEGAEHEHGPLVPDAVEQLPRGAFVRVRIPRTACPPGHFPSGMYLTR